MCLWLDRGEILFYLKPYKIDRKNKMVCYSDAFEGAHMMSDCRMPRGILKTN